MFRPTRQIWTRRKRELDQEIWTLRKIVIGLVLDAVLAGIIFGGAVILILLRPTPIPIIVGITSAGLVMLCAGLVNQKRRDKAGAKQARLFVEDQLQMIRDASKSSEK